MVTLSVAFQHSSGGTEGGTGVGGAVTGVATLLGTKGLNLGVSTGVRQAPWGRLPEEADGGFSCGASLWTWQTFTRN